ncbi:NmrA family protein [Botrytis cinerea]
MAGDKILVLGGTGPAGICVLRELVFRKHSIVVYARNPSKIPSDLATNSLIEIIKGDLLDQEALALAVAPSYSSFYELLFPIMRANNVRRVFAMGTLSIRRPEDKFSVIQYLVRGLMPILASAAYQTVMNIAATFDKLTSREEIDWTVFRIAGIPGGDDEASWKADREGGRDFVGAVGGKGWAMNQKRGALARWLVDAAEGKADEWICRMPAVAAGVA